jgi:hypothetical protein
MRKFLLFLVLFLVLSIILQPATYAEDSGESRGYSNSAEIE